MDTRVDRPLSQQGCRGSSFVPPRPHQCLQNHCTHTMNAPRPPCTRRGHSSLPRRETQRHTRLQWRCRLLSAPALSRRGQIVGRNPSTAESARPAMRPVQTHGHLNVQYFAVQPLRPGGLLPDLHPKALLAGDSAHRTASALRWHGWVEKISQRHSSTDPPRPAPRPYSCSLGKTFLNARNYAIRLF